MIKFKLNSEQESRFYEWQREVFTEEQLAAAAEEDCCCTSPFTFHFSSSGLGDSVYVTGLGKKLDLSYLGDWG